MRKIKDIEGMKYLFIDEIQNIKGFEEVINAFREKGDISIFITGSNSYLLSGELVTKLTGRYIEFEMSTLSFDEYIGMKLFFGKTVAADLEEEFNNYISEGEFPYAINLDSFEDKRLYTQSNIRKETVYNYLRILESTKIIQKCSRFDLKSKKSLRGEEKYYLSDLSFYFANNTDNRIEYGPVLENIVFLYSHHYDGYYF